MQSPGQRCYADGSASPGRESGDSNSRSDLYQKDHAPGSTLHCIQARRP